MKGPRSRHRFNVKRVWECPACKKRVFAPPQVSSRACPCTPQSSWMCLIEPGPKKPKPESNDTPPA